MKVARRRVVMGAPAVGDTKGEVEEGALNPHKSLSEEPGNTLLKMDTYHSSAWERETSVHPRKSCDSREPYDAG